MSGQILYPFSPDPFLSAHIRFDPPVCHPYRQLRETKNQQIQLFVLPCAILKTDIMINDNNNLLTM